MNFQWQALAGEEGKRSLKQTITQNF